MRTILIRDYTFAALKFHDKNSIVHVNNSSYIQKQFLTTSKSIIDVSPVTLIIQLPQLLNNTLTQLAIFVYDLYNYFAWHSHMSHSRFNSVHFVTLTFRNEGFNFEEHNQSSSITTGIYSSSS